MVDKATFTFSAMDRWQWACWGLSPGPSACEADGHHTLHRALGSGVFFWLPRFADGADPSS